MKLLRRPLRLAAIGCVALAGCVVFGQGASAQTGIMGNNLGAPTGPVVNPGPGKGPKAPLPPALPGTRAGGGEVAPADKGVVDLQPTDALFDAINRGDMPAARDALNRGADLGGRNVLGMTPTELSVDLGRNDITFLLLSMRGPGDSNNSGRSAGQAAADAKAALALPRAAPARAATAVPSPRAPRAAAPASDRQYAIGQSAPGQSAPGASNPGTAIPQAGFLGFGVTR